MIRFAISGQPKNIPSPASVLKKDNTTTTAASTTTPTATSVVKGGLGVIRGVTCLAWRLVVLALGAVAALAYGALVLIALLVSPLIALVGFVLTKITFWIMVLAGHHPCDPTCGGSSALARIFCAKVCRSVTQRGFFAGSFAATMVFKMLAFGGVLWLKFLALLILC